VNEADVVVDGFAGELEMVGAASAGDGESTEQSHGRNRGPAR
jgi:hypothetical protein